MLYIIQIKRKPSKRRVYTHAHSWTWRGDFWRESTDPGAGKLGLGMRKEGWRPQQLPVHKREMQRAAMA